MKRLLPVLLLLPLILGCRVQKYDTTTYYYECERSDGFYVYPTDDVASDPIVYIPAHTTIYTKTTKRKQFIKVYCGTHHGYVYNRGLKFKKTKYKAIPDYIVKDQDIDFLVWLDKHELPSRHKSDSEPSYNSGGSVNVKGHYRSNGTYVQPYTRRAPSRH